MNAIRMHFALIQTTVMVAFVKMDLMVMDSIAVYYVSREQNHLKERASILTNAKWIQQFVRVQIQFVKISLVHILVLVPMDSLVMLKTVLRIQWQQHQAWRRAFLHQVNLYHCSLLSVLSVILAICSHKFCHVNSISIQDDYVLRRESNQSS